MMKQVDFMTAAERTRWICGKARAIGFDLCGVAPVDALEELAHFPESIERGYAGEMDYLCDPRRANPREILAGARSLIVIALNYNTQHPNSTEIPPTTGLRLGR
jgi:epoxyqueuosine reductase QueG